MTVPARAATTPGPTASGADVSGVAADGERLRERLIYWAYRAGERVLNTLPRSVTLPIAASAGNLAYDVAGPKRELLHANLAHALRTGQDDPRVARAARRAFRNYARYLVDMMRLAGLTDRDAQRLVSIDNIEDLRSARAEGRGVILCTVHVGGMDLIGPGLKLSGEALNVVADDTTYGRLYEHLKAIRDRQGLHLIGWRNLRGLFRVLRDGGNLVLFCDGGFRRGDVPVEFLGEATTFPAGPATLSARSGAPMMPVSCRRTPQQRFRARGLPLVRAASSEPAEIHRATQQVADELAEVIADDPGQWYMFRPVWPQTDADRAFARAALASARAGEDWSRLR
ncbi:MAG: lysophospholipid acyltransferase family protein [Candidatus Limnocylindria bacterium]